MAIVLCAIIKVYPSCDIGTLLCLVKIAFLGIALHLLRKLKHLLLILLIRGGVYNLLNRVAIAYFLRICAFASSIKRCISGERFDGSTLFITLKLCFLISSTICSPFIRAMVS